MTKQATTLSSPLEDQRFAWLDALADPLQKAWHGIFRANDATMKAKSILNGQPIKHRVHPAIIIVPLGAWATGAFLDVLDATRGGAGKESGFRAGADASVVLGLVGAMPAAVAGLADWVDTYDQHRRVGMAHVVLNSVSLALYAGSLGLRLAGEERRGAARALGFVALGVVTLSGALGGELVYNLGVNVPHILYPKAPDEWTDVIAADDLPEGARRLVDVNGVPILLYRFIGDVLAVEAWCPHAGGPLYEGTFDGAEVECPWHQSRFDLRDGAPTQGPASSPLRTFAVREEGGRIAVRPSFEGQEWPPAPAPFDKAAATTRAMSAD